MAESSSVFGKYRLLAELGHGGMADVFLAVQAGPVGSGFSKLTVIKRLRRNLADEPEFVSMLVDEARIAARLNHPNVVQTNEVGEVDQHYFIAMEYLDGQPFHRLQNRAAQHVKKGGAPLLTKEQEYLVLMDALAGLHHAHELTDYDGTKLEIVHRDITPHNIFVTYEGQVKVVDFGVAKAVGRASETRQGVIKGKVRYMAPEQALGRSIDRRADVFAAGVLLWEIAVGRRMWKDKDELEVVRSMAAGELPPSPREVDPSVPEAIDAICRRAIRIDPEERYATAEDFRAELEQFLADSGQLFEARRRLPRVISDLFADKRAEIKRIIESQLSLLSAKHTAATVLPVAMGPESMPGSGSGSGSGPTAGHVSRPSIPSGSFSLPPQSQGPRSERTALSASPGSVTVESSEPASGMASFDAPSTKRRRGLVAVVAAATLALAAFGVWRLTSTNDGNGDQEVAQQTSAMPSASSAQPGEEAPASAPSREPAKEATREPEVTPAKSAEVAAAAPAIPTPPAAAVRAAAPSRVGTRPAQTQAHEDSPPPAPAHETKGHAPPARPTPAPSPSPVSPPSPATAATVAAAPAPAVAPGYIDPKGVRATVRAHASEAQACYDRAQLEKADLKGTIAIGATVGPAGDVLAANITSATVRHARLESCLLGAFRSWRFPAPAGGVNGSVSYNFRFE